MRGERGLLERLRGGEVLVGDGAIGVRLGAYGHRPGECPERWSLDHPEALRAIHAGYIAAGADVVLTNTLGGSRVALGRYGLAGEVEAINRGLAELLAETIAASGRRAHLAGDVGPTGELLARTARSGSARRWRPFASRSPRSWPAAPRSCSSRR